MTKEEIKKAFAPFKEIKEPRTTGKIDHILEDILMIALFAVISGAESWNDIEDYGREKRKWLKSFLRLPNGIPSHDTFNRVFSMIDPNQFQSSFIQWVADLRDKDKKEIIAIDGKTIRRSGSKANLIPALHIVSAWASENRLVLGQVKVNEKSNEITAIPELLDLIAIKGSIITIDAMGCQKEIASKIKSNEADYVFGLKGNHGNFFEDVEYYFKAELGNRNWKKLIDYHITIEKDHGRIEKRKYYVTSDVDWLENKADWIGLSSIGMVVSERSINGKKTVETRYYISSMSKDAKEFGRAVRGHWGIENSLHWCLDIGFREDESRARLDNAGLNLAILRHVALNLLKQEKTSKRGIKGKRLKAAWSIEYLLKIIFG